MAQATNPHEFISSNRTFPQQASEWALLRCEVCTYQFNKSDRIPKMLTSRHTFCQKCLQEMFGFSHVIHAPERTADVQIEGSVHALPTDDKIVELIKLNTVKSQNHCPQHDGQPLQFFCEKSEMPICGDCKNTIEAKGFRTIEFSDALKTYASSFDTTEKFALNALDEMTRKLNTNRAELNRLDVTNQSLANEISEKFKDYKEILDKRETYLIGKANKRIRTYQDDIIKDCALIEDKMRDLKYLLEKLKLACACDDSRQMFKTYLEIRNKRWSFKYAAASDDFHVCRSVKFYPRSHDEFLFKLDQIGVVYTHGKLERREMKRAERSLDSTDPVLAKRESTKRVNQ